MAILDLEELDRQSLVDDSKSVVEAEKQVRITLAADWPRVVPLNWHIGRGGHDTMIPLRPGETVVQPLAKSQVWFGPFSIPAEYAKTADEGRKERLRSTWATEKKRYLDRYDYPRPASAMKNGLEPTGPHRSPDVTVVIVEADGTESEPIRLYELYKIGEFDPIAHTFAKQESPEDVKARYEAELASVSERYEREQAEMRRQLSEMAGMVKAFAAQQAPAPAAK